MRKLDWVGHVHKRMGAHLRKFVSENKKIIINDGGRVNGANRLTHFMIDQ